jgi:hypothetical protein
MLSKQLGVGLQNPFSAIGIHWMILLLNTFAIYIGLSIDEGIDSRPPFWVSHWLGSRHWGLANWLSPLVLHPRCSLIAFPFLAIISVEQAYFP